VNKRQWKKVERYFNKLGRSKKMDDIIKKINEDLKKENEMQVGGIIDMPTSISLDALKPFTSLNINCRCMLTDEFFDDWDIEYK